MVAETQASVCFDCHKDRRAELHRVFTDPTKNGFFSCSACHAPHGLTAQRASLQKNTVNETCYTCHAQLRGPFLWEHRSAQDDCTNCHNPHGTNIAPMLKARMPYLCQQCHQTALSSSIAFSGTSLPGGASAAQGEPDTRQCLRKLPHEGARQQSSVRRPPAALSRHLHCP